MIKINMHKNMNEKLWKNNGHFLHPVEKNRNIEHFLGTHRKKIVKSVHNSGTKCYN